MNPNTPSNRARIAIHVDATRAARIAASSKYGIDPGAHRSYFRSAADGSTLIARRAGIDTRAPQ